MHGPYIHLCKELLNEYKFPGIKLKLVELLKVCANRSGQWTILGYKIFWVNSVLV